MRILAALNILAITALLSACEKNPTSNVLTFEPSSLPNCEKASEIVVKWNVRSAYPDVQAVQINVIDGDSEVVFGVGGAEGETKTGAWVKPGIPRFVLKDKINGTTLGEGFVSGPKCQ